MQTDSEYCRLHRHECIDIDSTMPVQYLKNDSLLQCMCRGRVVIIHLLLVMANNTETPFCFASLKK